MDVGVDNHAAAGVGALKRSFPDSQQETNGREKRLGSSMESNTETAFRILCPGSRIGAIIGRGGSIVKQIRDETGARVKIADAVPGVDERVVIVSGLEDKEREWSPAQEGLFRVYDRILDVAPEETVAPTGTSTAARLLIPAVQVGCILGKGGSIIQQMREETGAQLRIMPKEQRPGCALPTDALLQLSGDLGVVRQALRAVSLRLRANPPRERPVTPRAAGVPLGVLGGGGVAPSPGGLGLGLGLGLGPGQLRVGAQAQQLAGTVAFGSQSQLRVGWPGATAALAHGGGGGPPTELVFRILCTASKTGSVIGKGGSIISHLREQTGARIKISDPIPGCDERVVIVSGNEVPGAPFSPAQEALLLVHARLLLESDLEPPPGTLATTRLLVPTAQIGCLLGKGGAIISEMRRLSYAQIRILPPEELPACAQALEPDDGLQPSLLQITGDLNANRVALHQASTRLRANHAQFRPPLPPAEAATAAGATQSFNALQQQQQPLTAPFLAAFAEPAAGNGAGAGPPTGPLFGLPAPAAQGLASSVPGGLGVATLHVTVPLQSVGSIIGKGGTNIAQIRNISGAKVKLHELAEGSEQREVELSGTPEQLQAAQSLLQAFIVSGQGGAAPAF